MKKLFLPEILFVILAFVLGLVLMFATPPFQSADETGHFAKVMALSRGEISPTVIHNKAGNYLPCGVFEFQKQYENVRFRAKTSFNKIKETKNITLGKDKTFIEESYIAMYSPVSYLPQGIGAFIGSKIFKSVYLIMIASKLSMLLFYMCFGYFAIRSIPFLKWVLFLILLTPMSLSLGASVSADAVLISIFGLYLAKILQFSYRDKVISKKELALLCIGAASLALVKQSFLLTLFVLFIPKEKFETHYFKKLALILCPAFILSALWAQYAYQFFVPLRGAIPKEQMEFILHNPLIYIQILIHTLKIQFWILTYSFVGLLGWFDVTMSEPKLKNVYWFLLFLNTFINFDIKNFETKWFQKLIWAFVIIFNFLFICTAIYASWNVPTRTGSFDGLQGRYFIPISMPFFVFVFFLINKYIKIPNYKYSIAIINCFLVVSTHISMLIGIFRRYY